MTKSNETAVAVIEQHADAGVVEWNLDGFPEAQYNRLVPVETLQIPTDLLRPVVQIVKLNPDPKAGDVYSSKDMPDGHAAPTRVGLRKFATAAGISFVDERRVDDGRDPDVIEVTCLAEMLLPTGQRIRATGTKRIDLNAQAWHSDNQRAKYRSFFQEHVASRAQNRAIRALLSLRGSYPASTYSKPFAVVSFAPNMAHPEVRSRILDAMAGTSAQLYGPAAAPQLGPGQAINVTPAAEEDPAPTTPTQLPGETLARTKPAVDADPTWFEAPAAKPTDPGDRPALAQLLRDNAEASGLVGAITDAQAERLKALLGRLGRDLTQAGMQRAFGLEPNERGRVELTAAQAQSLINVAESRGHDTFLEEYRAMAEAA